MITLIDGDMLTVRWRHTDVPSSLSSMLQYLYKLRRFPLPFMPPKSMAVAFSSGTYRQAPYIPRPISSGVKTEIIGLLEEMAMPVIVRPNLESVDCIASAIDASGTTIVSDDERLLPLMSQSCHVFRPSQAQHGASGPVWELYEREDWEKQYGRMVCRNWPSFMELIGQEQHNIARSLPPRKAAKECANHRSTCMDLFIVDDIEVPDITAELRATLLKTDIERIAEAMANLDQERFNNAYEQLKHEVDPSLPTEFKQGTVEKQVVISLREEAGIPLWVKGDASGLGRKAGPSDGTHRYVGE